MEKEQEQEYAFTYIRVSTDGQGRSGLGQDAQRADILIYAKIHNIIILEEFIEVESGTVDDKKRPVLHAALERAKAANHQLIMSKPCRLSRNAGFVTELLETKKLNLTFCAFGKNPNPFFIKIFALLSEEEANWTSQRTKAALKIARDRGVKLGNPRLQETAQRKGTAATKAKADRFALHAITHIRKYRSDGTTQQKAAQLMNDAEIKTARKGGKWTASRIGEIEKRVAAMEAPAEATGNSQVAA